MKIIKYIGFLLWIVFLSYLSQILFSRPPEGVVVTPQPTVKVFTVPAEVEPIVTKLGIDRSVLKDVQIITPDTASKCSGVLQDGAAVACYFDSKPPTIYMPQTALRSSNATTTFAHEYMHHVWANKISDSERAQLSREVRSFYQANRSVVEPRFKSYLNAGLTQDGLTNEMQAIFCTEISDSRLPRNFYNYCARFLPNRNALPSYF